MSPKLLPATILTAILGLGLSAVAAAQSAPQASRVPASPVASRKVAKTPTKLPLKDMTFISTAEAAHEAATATNAKAQGQTPAKPGQTEGGGVVEFQPAKAGWSADSGSGWTARTGSVMTCYGSPRTTRAPSAP